MNVFVGKTKLCILSHDCSFIFESYFKTLQGSKREGGFSIFNHNLSFEDTRNMQTKLLKMVTSLNALFNFAHSTNQHHSHRQITFICFYRKIFVHFNINIIVIGLDCPITMDTLSRVSCFTTTTSSSNIPFPRISPTPCSTLPTVSVLRTSPRPGQSVWYNYSTFSSL